MNLNFNFDAKTLLSKWWTVVRDNFKSIQTDFNAHLSEFNTAKQNLQKQITDETDAREKADEALQQKILSETNARSAADDALGGRISGEISEREKADSLLEERIDKENAERKSSFSGLESRVSAAEQKSHTHSNKGILDGINEECVERWNAKSETGVTKSEFDALSAYIENLVMSAASGFDELWTAVGVTIFDGGIFGAEQTDTPLDGGLFEDAELEPLDCGGFEPYVMPSGGVGTVVDGGNY